jgi:protein-L-isoaspartate O-methyltransferase
MLAYPPCSLRIVAVIPEKGTRPVMPSRSCRGFFFALAVIGLLGMPGTPLSGQGPVTIGQTKATMPKLAPYYPTPYSVVEKMLEMAKVKPADTVFDLGSGDGRIVVMAAEQFKATAVGVEFDNSLVTQSRATIKRRGLEKKARIIAGDMMVQDYSTATVVTVYLLPTSNEKMWPILKRQLKPGTRIVCHDFEFSALTAKETITIEDDGEGRSHTLFLYIVE